MQTYLNLLTHVMENGVDKSDRTQTGTRSIFGYQMRFNLSEGFPLLTTKKMFLKGIIHELLWFLSGSTNIEYLVKNDVKIWNQWPFQSYLEHNNLLKKFPKYSPEWSEKMQEFIENIATNHEFAKKWWELGPVYGKQWRDFWWIDQISEAISQIQTNPDSRRIIVSAWNPPEIPDMIKSGLPPCHCLFQFYVANGKLSCQLYQRSADIFLGIPFNIASYSLLVLMIAKVTGLEPWEFVHTLWDGHIYANHFDQVRTQLSRSPLPLPQMNIAQKTNIFDFVFEDFTLENYQSHERISAPIAV